MFIEVLRCYSFYKATTVLFMASVRTLWMEYINLTYPINPHVQSIHQTFTCVPPTLKGISGNESKMNRCITMKPQWAEKEKMVAYHSRWVRTSGGASPGGESHFWFPWMWKNGKWPMGRIAFRLQHRRTHPPILCERSGRFPNAVGVRVHSDALYSLPPLGPSLVFLK